MVAYQVGKPLRQIQGKGSWVTLRTVGLSRVPALRPALFLAWHPSLALLGRLDHREQRCLLPRTTGKERVPAGLGGAWKGRAGKSPSRRSRQSELRRRRQRPALEPPASPLCSPPPESQSQPLISSAFTASSPRGFPLGLTSRSCLHTQSNAFRLVPSTWAMAQSAGLKAGRLERRVLVLLLGSVLLWTGEWGGAGRKLGGGGEGAVQPPKTLPYGFPYPGPRIMGLDLSLSPWLRVGPHGGGALQRRGRC